MCQDASAIRLLTHMSQRDKVRRMTMRRHPLHINGMMRWMRTCLTDVSLHLIYHLLHLDVELRHPPPLRWPWVRQNTPTICHPDSMSWQINLRNVSMRFRMVITKRTPRSQDMSLRRVSSSHLCPPTYGHHITTPITSTSTKDVSRHVSNLPDGDAQHTSLTSENGYLARSDYVYPASTFVNHHASSWPSYHASGDTHSIIHHQFTSSSLR